MKNVSKKCKKNIVLFDFSNHTGAQVPIFTAKIKRLELARFAHLARGNGIFDAACDLENSRTGARMT